jgi:hypothetical protein
MSLTPWPGLTPIEAALLAEQEEVNRAHQLAVTRAHQERYNGRARQARLSRARQAEVNRASAGGGARQAEDNRARQAEDNRARQEEANRAAALDREEARQEETNRAFALVRAQAAASAVVDFERKLRVNPTEISKLALEMIENESPKWFAAIIDLCAANPADERVRPFLVKKTTYSTGERGESIETTTATLTLSATL